MIIHYLKVAVRNLLKYKTQNLISIVGLAVGLFCFCICFYISRFIASVDRCFENHERIAEIILTIPEEGRDISGVSGKIVPDLRQSEWTAAEAFTFVSYSQSKVFTITGTNNEQLPYKLTIMETDSLYKRVFTPKLITGSWEQASHTRNAIVLTEQAAKLLFSTPANAIGQTMILNTPRYNDAVVTYTVQAVIKDLPENTSMNFMEKVDLLTLNDDDGYELSEANTTGYYAYALLKDGQTTEQLDLQIKNTNYMFPMFGTTYPAKATPMEMDKNLTSMATMMSLITAIVGLLILLAASLNFFHFQTGNFLNRSREFGIRKILGNKTSGLFSMLFIQITVVILIATVISGCLIELASPFLELSIFRFSIQIEKDALLLHLLQYMGMLLGITALVAAGISGYIRYATPQTSMHGYGKSNGKKRLRNTLLGIQFFISWLFIAMAVALYLQSEKTTSSLFDTLTQKEKEEIISLPLKHEFLDKEDKRIILNRISQHAGVKDILTTENRFTARVNAMYDSPDKKSYKLVQFMNVSSNFASFFHLDIEGRTTEQDEEILIGRDFADQYDENPIGKTLYDHSKAYTIVGIMENLNSYVYNDGFGKANYPKAYMQNDNDNDFCYIKCHSGQTEDVQAWIGQVLKEIYPANMETRTKTFIDEIKESQDFENKLKDIILFFSIVCLIITLLGVYSAITLDTERRQKEVAIRKVNGAGLKEIILLFARLYIWVLGISATIALPIVYLIIQQWKQMYLVFFNDGILYWGGILLGVTSITALTVIFRILKVARINPASIIKNE